MVPKRLVVKQMGELLVEQGLLGREQLTHALEVQRQRGGMLGQILVSLGHVSEEAVAQALTAQYGFPYLPLKHYLIDSELVRMIPENVARQYYLIPVDRIGDTLTIAMADPLNVRAVEDVEMISRCSVQVFVSTLTEVAEAIARSYGEPKANG